MMWKIDDRVKFLTVFHSLEGEYASLIFHIVVSTIIIVIFFNYIPTSHLSAISLTLFIIFTARWISINRFLNLKDGKYSETLKRSSMIFQLYILFLTLTSISLSLISFCNIEVLPIHSQNIIYLTLFALITFYTLSPFIFLNAYILFILPIELPLFYYMINSQYMELQTLSLFGLLIISLSIISLKNRERILIKVAKRKIEAERYKEQINREVENLRKYIEVLDEVDIGTVIVDDKNRIIYHSVTLQRWFNINNNMSFDRFFASIIKDFNELNKREIISKSGRNYKLASNVIEDIDDNIYSIKVFRDTTKEYRYNKASFRETLFHPSMDEYDRLTKLLKRESFFKYLNQAIYEADITFTKIALMIIDINSFNYINDMYGEKVGNEVLRILSKRLKNSTRDSDLVGRYGDDELIVALKLIESLDTVKVVAKKILKNLILPFRIIDDKDIFITINIGISIYPNDTKDVQKVIEQAYKTLIEAKRRKRNGYLLYRDIALMPKK